MAIPNDIAFSPARRDPRRGVLLMVAGIALFSILNGVVKAQSEIFPINQIIFFRNVFAVVVVLAMVEAAGGLSILRTKRRGEHVLLSGMFTATLFMIFAAYSMMPLAEATAIAFTQPLIVTLLSLSLAADKVRPGEWAAVAVGFGGVILVVQPTGEGPALGAMLALGGSAMSAFAMLLQRRLSATEATHAISFYTLGLSAVAMAPTLFFSWTTPTPLQLLGLVAMGVASGFCQYLTVRAFYHAPASTIAPVTYTKMIWAIVIGFVWFGETPTALAAIGAVVVIGSTLLVFRTGAKPTDAA